MRLLLWRALDWYSQQFNDCWGFPTSCVLDSRTRQEGICHAIHSNHRYLAFFPEDTANEFFQRNPNIDKFLCASYFGILSIWIHFFSLKMDVWFVSFTLVFSMAMALVQSRGRVNLPYILAKLCLIDRHDVHHGTSILDPHHFLLRVLIEPLCSPSFQVLTSLLGLILCSSAFWLS